MTRRFIGSIFFALVSCAPQSALYNPPLRMVVIKKVADVRVDTSLRSSKYDYDERQETQVLDGEVVLVKERRGKWVRVECEEQREFTHASKWEGYPGWMDGSALSADLNKYDRPPRTKLNEKELRKRVLNEARRHLGNPYLWGGRSLHNPAIKFPLTGVDCSGLISWSFREVGLFVPRDSHEQYMRARKVEVKALEPGDLFFLAKVDKPEKIVHVGFITGSERLLEAPQSGERVREVTFKERFGIDLSSMRDGQIIGDRVIYFGTLFTGGV